MFKTGHLVVIFQQSFFTEGNLKLNIKQTLVLLLTLIKTLYLNRTEPLLMSQVTLVFTYYFKMAAVKKVYNESPSVTLCLVNATMTEALGK